MLVTGEYPVTEKREIDQRKKAIDTFVSSYNLHEPRQKRDKRRVGDRRRAREYRSDSMIGDGRRLDIRHLDWRLQRRCGHLSSARTQECTLCSILPPGLLLHRRDLCRVRHLLLFGLEVPHECELPGRVRVELALKHAHHPKVSRARLARH